MTKIILQLLTDDGLNNLKEHFVENIPHYLSKDKRYFSEYLTQNNYLVKTSYEIDDFTSKLVYSNNSDNDDFENIKTLYTAMMELPVYLMMDDHFWASFTHTYMFDYVTRRSEAYKTNTLNQRDKLYNSFFTHTKNGKKRGTFVNCVSRLWWAGFLTYEDSLKDPFSLTSELCRAGFPSTIVPFSSSNITSREPARKALLYVIKSLRENGQRVKRDEITYGIRYLNLISGSMLLDMIDEEELINIFLKYYVRYYQISDSSVYHVKKTLTFLHPSNNN